MSDQFLSDNTPTIGVSALHSIRRSQLTQRTVSMNHSAIASKVFPAIVKIFFASTFLSLVLLPVNSVSSQKSAKPKIRVRTTRADRLPMEESIKADRREGQQPQEQKAGEEPATSTSIDCNTVLLLGDVEEVRLFAINFEPNSTETFTTTQSNPGVIGFSLTQAGPFVEAIQFSVTMDGSGSGLSQAYYVQGQMLGFTSHFCTSQHTVGVIAADYNVIPQCNCPLIPLIP